MSYSTSQPLTSVRSKKLNPLYGLAFVGGLLLALASFLAWYNFSLGTGKAGDNFSITGMGTTDASSQLAQFMADSAGKAGIFSLFIGGLIGLLGLLGLLLNKKGFAIAGIVFSLLGAALMVLKLSQTASIGEGASVGMGIYLGVVGALVALVGNILPLMLKRR